MPTIPFENCLYYTFSTISQTVAAGLGLLAGVTLYRLQKLNQDRDLVVGELVHNDHNNETLLLQSRGQWGEMVSYFKERCPFRESPVVVGRVAQLELALAAIDKVKKKLSESTWATGMTILLSIFFLILTPFIKGDAIFSMMLLVFGLLLTLGNLAQYYRLIKSIL